MLTNKLGIKSESELAREEERISKKRAANYFLAERSRSYKEDGATLSYNKTANLLVKMKKDKDPIKTSLRKKQTIQNFIQSMEYRAIEPEIRAMEFASLVIKLKYQR